MDELARRRKLLFEAGKGKFDSVLLHSDESAAFRYFSGCEVDGCYLLLRRNSGVLLANEMELGRAKEESAYPVRLLGKDRAGKIRKAAGRGKVGTPLAEMDAARFVALKKNAKLRLVDAGEAAGKVRGRKSGAELEALSAAAEIARGILEGLDPWECRTEEELAARLKVAALEAGAEASFSPIVATGRNASQPHHAPAAKKLEEAVLVDFGVRKEGYCSDLTRCYFKGGAKKERQAYEKCQEVFWQLLELLGDCGNGSEAAAAAESLMRKNGLPRLVHAIGHGIGMEVHEWPRLGAKSGDSLEGAALALEPAAYFRDFGVRFEEMVANLRGGWRPL